MITFQKTKNFKIDDLNERENSVSTLLIPAHLIEGLKLRRRLFGKEMSVYLRNLLQMYRLFSHSGLLPKPRKIKTEYQKEGLNLKRVSFRPDNADWLELGHLALAFGKSRCYVFTFLLELDLSGFTESLHEADLIFAVPTSSKFRLKVSYSLGRISQDFTRSFHVRI